MTEPFPQPGENPLLDAQLKEAAEVSTFINSPVWPWLKTRLTNIKAGLMAKATSPGTKRDDRMLYLGKLALVEEILSRPGMLMDLTDRKAAAEMAIPEVRAILKQAPIRAKSAGGML